MKTPLLDNLKAHGLHADILARGEAYGVLRYLDQPVLQFNLGKVDFPNSEHVEKWIKNQGVEKVIARTKLQRMFALNDFISDESDLLKSVVKDGFSHRSQKIDFVESEKTQAALEGVSISQIYPRYHLDQIIDSIHTEEDVREYAREHGRILAGEDWSKQRLHYATGTGKDIKPLAVAENEQETNEAVVSTERQSIREMISGLGRVAQVAMEFQSEKE